MDLWVSVDVVQESLHVLDVLVHVHDVVVGGHHLSNHVPILHFLLLGALLKFLPAYDLDSSMLVATEKGEALW